MLPLPIGVKNNFLKSAFQAKKGKKNSFDIIIIFEICRYISQINGTVD